MDWYLDSADLDATAALRTQVADYLERHAEPGADIHGAALIFAETIANAIEHAGGSIWVSLDWSETSPVLTVHDLGPGFVPDPKLPDDPYAEGGRGLFLVSHLTSELAVAAKRAGGSRVTVRLPVHRREEPSTAPAGVSGSSLPTSPEAAEDGMFGRESFLRALVVELAQAVEFAEGPVRSEATVARVGTQIGGRMEEEYRRARGLVTALDPDAMADLYVRLKAAIDGDFYVIEATDSKIVLGNRACPFGDVVQRAPALCRMTSSVFGGIAARNTGQATVRLEERIAVGDPECRVTVWLGEAAAQHPGHRYHAAT